MSVKCCIKHMFTDEHRCELKPFESIVGVYLEMPFDNRGWNAFNLTTVQNTRKYMLYVSFCVILKSNAGEFAFICIIKNFTVDLVYKKKKLLNNQMGQL